MSATGRRWSFSLTAAWLLMGIFSSGCSGCTRKLQEEASLKHALEMCEEVSHTHGTACRSEVEKRFPGCHKLLAAGSVEFEFYAQCLGFVTPEESEPTQIIGRCSGSNMSATLFASVAKSAPHDDNSPRVIDGQTLYVSNKPVLTTPDIQALKIEQEEFYRLVVLEISNDASRRLEEATRQNIGEKLFIKLNNHVVAPKIASPVTGPSVTIVLKDAQMKELCRQP